MVYFVPSHGNSMSTKIVWDRTKDLSFDVIWGLAMGKEPFCRPAFTNTGMPQSFFSALLRLLDAALED